ncbi:hypothetical protein PHYSODRAFT_260618 [Phytophthora sojae]|uniref:Uncharacterized protein n=1 Tax=Phytophthora sojae (strain P6497) TaxID=1094619 RepID=G5A303_PHYSP|nr:hypothetical protein PHYSODRAFT_260618 [Phytophthora sojae]EGZ10043.1 hypothetical protein PHYSODRAFT_260618 [Phytophthora sojae]|eukprot:XP_009534904.1 hypothetical protein PHYSODRAFT_260618 [Phytophthora sojae]
MKFAAAAAALISFVIVGTSADGGSSACPGEICPLRPLPFAEVTASPTTTNMSSTFKTATTGGSKWTVLHQGTCNRSEGGK